MITVFKTSALRHGISYIWYHEALSPLPQAPWHPASLRTRLDMPKSEQLPSGEPPSSTGQWTSSFASCGMACKAEEGKIKADTLKGYLLPRQARGITATCRVDTRRGCKMGDSDAWGKTQLRHSESPVWVCTWRPGVNILSTYSVLNMLNI